MFYFKDSPCEGTGCLNNGTSIVSKENIVCKCIDGLVEEDARVGINKCLILC